MFRTPTKMATQDPNTTVTLPGPSTGTDGQSRNVRRSIGDWESGIIAAGPAPPQTATEARSPKKNPIAQRPLSTDVTISPPKLSSSKTTDRIAEARSLMIKAKQYINSSRNLKTDIKNGVLQAIERMYQLVKDSEASKNISKTTVKQPPVKTKEENGTEELRQQRRSLEELVGKQTELIKENNEKMENLKEILTKTTYASVTATKPQTQLPKLTALHSLVVTSKKETDTGEQVLERVRHTINAKEGGIKIDRIRKAKDGKLIVGCNTVEERDRVKERLKLAESHLIVENMKNKDPLLIFKDVLNYNSDEDIINALKNQNTNIYQHLSTEDTRIEIRYRKRTRNPHSSHVVARVSPTVWKRMVQAEVVHIDLQRVKVTDHSPLVQCSLCLGYGHSKRLCKETQKKCSHCGGPHMRHECEEWIAGVSPSCCNCKKAGLETVNHNAFNQECVIRQKWDALARSTIAYC